MVSGFEVHGSKPDVVVADTPHVQLVSDTQVRLAVTRNCTSRSPLMMVLLLILRKLREEDSIRLDLQCIRSAFKIGADRLSRRRDASDWMLTPAAVADI
jgi:hypothetical protein